MKKITSYAIQVMAVLLLLSTFTACKKKQFLKYGNQIILINPFISFKQDHPEFIMGFGGDCQLIILDKDGAEIVLETYGITDKEVIINIDWGNYEDQVNLKSAHTFISRVGYYDEDSYYIVQNSNGGTEIYLSPDFYDHYVTQEMENSFKMEPNRIYTFNPLKNTFVDEGTYKEKESNSSSSSSGIAINGKWMATGKCANSNGESTWFQFNSGSGSSFSADCNSACTGLGVKFHYTYTATSSTIDITWTGVDDYCGVSSATPSPETMNYSISGDVMTINGSPYQKQ